jgi:3-oxoadipate enol-lactonase
MRLLFIDRIAIEDEGSGDPVVCLHGLGGSTGVWTPMLTPLKGYRLLRIELPGSARSLRAEGPLSIERFVACVEHICERLSIRHANWMGHSLGTIVAQHLALVHPNRVRSLALFGPLAEPAQAMRAPLRARAALARDESVCGMLKIAIQTATGSLSADTRARQPLVAAMVRESVARSCPDGYARSCEALADARSAALEQIKQPVLLVTGDEDAIAPPQAMRSLADRLTASPLVQQRVFGRCGHWTPLERPGECLREWSDFVNAAGRLPARVVHPAYAMGVA